MGYSFEPNGLPGYRVFRDPTWAGSPHGDWFFDRPADVPHTFAWDDTTQDHTDPVFNDWSEGPRKTAKGAVAAAHAHHKWATEKLRSTEATSPLLLKATRELLALVEEHRPGAEAVELGRAAIAKAEGSALSKALSPGEREEGKS